MVVSIESVTRTSLSSYCSSPGFAKNFLRQSSLLGVLVFLVLCSRKAVECCPPSTSKPLVLRIRQLDGSIQRLQFQAKETTGSLNGISLEQVLQKSRDILELSMEGQEPHKECALQFGNHCFPLKMDGEGEEQMDKSLEELGIRHGSLLSIVPGIDSGNSTTPEKGGGLQQKKKTVDQKQPSSSSDRWDPYPELAKDYEKTVRQIERRKLTGGRLSFADLSKLHRALHVVEAQPTASLLRLYLCPVVAERFATASKTGSSLGARVALLFGTIHRERRDPKKLRHRTSLSSTTEVEEYCQVAKVKAVWEPPQKRKQEESSSRDSSLYDATELLQFARNERVMNVAQWLGLVPVGWMYSYPENRQASESGGGGNDEVTLPVFGLDVQAGAQLQIECMKRYGREEGQRFVTVAMHGPTGATEAFQLSDVTVQMVAENMLCLLKGDKRDQESDDCARGTSSSLPKRFVPTRYAILVDERETTTLDSVLCLVNTALLQQQGSFVGSNGSPSGVKSSNPYQLTKRTRKTLAQAATAAMAAVKSGTDKKESNKSSSACASLLELLCNFQILVALYEDLSQEDMKLLVETVRKFARGPKKGTTVDRSVLQRLQQVLNQDS